MNSLLRDCQAGLKHATDVFGIRTGTTALNNLEDFKKTVTVMHNKLLELIETFSDASVLSERSSVYWGVNESRNSSNSFSILPSKPKIFYGREQELGSTLNLLGQLSPRIAILGGGGMGKTTLARMVLHHPETLSKFEHRCFVSAEAATNSIELASLVGLHLGLSPGKDLRKTVVQYFSRKMSSILILDNLETVWEPIQARPGVEDFLCLLTEVKSLALIITMRGAERPAKVQWSHPFLSPLQTLSNDAARQIFMDITDHSGGMEEIDQLLHLTDNMPLAVDLIAHLADHEGLSNVLSRWETERTSLLSVGFDRQSSLDASIGLSLASPRITPDSKELLSLLSILPNGLSDAELLHLRIPNILSCKAMLQATSLVYQDSNRRILLLMPLRQYIHKFMPPSQAHIQAIRQHFYSLLQCFQKYHEAQLQPVVNEITLNLANLQEVLQQGLHRNSPAVADTIDCVLSLNRFHRVTGRDHTVLMDYIEPVLSQEDHRLKIKLLIEHILTYHYLALVSDEAIACAICQLDHVNDPLLESKFYQAAAFHLHYVTGDSHRAAQFFQKALELSEQCEDHSQQGGVLIGLAWLKYEGGDHCGAQRDASSAQRQLQLAGNLYQGARANKLQAACSSSQGRYQESMTYLLKAKELIGICGLRGSAVDHDITNTQGSIHMLKTEYVQGRRLFSQVVKTTSAEENSLEYGMALLNLAEIDIEIGAASEDVYQNLDKVTEIYRTKHSTQRYATFCDSVSAQIELREGQFESASAKFQKCLYFSWGIARDLGCFCLEYLSNIDAWPASPQQHKWPMIYLVYAYKSKNKLALHKALVCLGDVFMVSEDRGTAASLYTVALEGFTHMDVHRSRAQCMLRLGDLENKHGHTCEAVALWKAARPLFKRSSQTKDVAHIDARLADVEGNLNSNFCSRC
ncbi:hypothetical protein K438DRAFT_1111867 [Mycena galopus ATCC 62051]|nr:hypothetical protein K438DRAFT_1111867 [Mycena galopus ATCC 62051]